MKKFLLFFILLILSAEVVSAQFCFGLKLGYNASKLSTDLGSVKSSFNSGFHFGAFVRIGNKIYIQPELYYTLQGGVFDNTGNLNTDVWHQHYTVGTLDIPVLAGYRLLNAKVISWHFNVGPQASFRVNKSVSGSGPVKETDLNDINWYIQVGTGVDVLFMTFDVRYQIGLNKMIKAVQDYTTDQNYKFDAIHNMWVISVGFKL